MVAVAAGLAVAATLGPSALIRSARGTKELTVSPKDLGDAELVTLPSAHRTAVTLNRLEKLLKEKGIVVFARIDHAAGAAAVEGLAVGDPGVDDGVPPPFSFSTSRLPPKVTACNRSTGNLRTTD